MEVKGKTITYPFGSKRISLTQLRQLAQALELPIGGNSADLQVMVEGKLREMERDPSSVQVVLEKDTGNGQTMLLEDESGPFLLVGTPDPISANHADSLDNVSISVKQDLQCTERSSEVQFAYEKFQVTELELQEQLEIAKVEICSLGEKLEQQRLSEEKLVQSLSNAEEKVSELISENNKLKNQLLLCPDLETLKKEVQQGKERIKELWTRNCDQVRELDRIIMEKDQEICVLRQMCLTINTTASQSGAPEQLCDPIIPVSTCVTLPSFTHFVCGKPTMATGVCETCTEVAQTTPTERSVTTTLLQSVCRSQVHTGVTQTTPMQRSVSTTTRPVYDSPVQTEQQLFVEHLPGGTDLESTTTQTRSFTRPITQPAQGRRALQTTTHLDPQVTQLSGIPQTLYALPSSASVLPSNEVMARNRFIDPLTLQATSPYVPSIQPIQ